MEQRKWDDSVNLEKLGQLFNGEKLDEEATEKFMSALVDDQTRFVAIHKPGSRVVKAGTEYEVQPDGSWKRVDE